MYAGIPKQDGCILIRSHGHRTRFSWWTLAGECTRPEERGAFKRTGRWLAVPRPGWIRFFRGTDLYISRGSREQCTEGDSGSDRSHRCPWKRCERWQTASGKEAWPRGTCNTCSLASNFPRATLPRAPLRSSTAPLCEVRASHVARVSARLVHSPVYVPAPVHTRAYVCTTSGGNTTCCRGRVDAEGARGPAGCLCATRNLYLIEPRSGKR